MTPLVPESFTTVIPQLCAVCALPMYGARKRLAAELVPAPAQLAIEVDTADPRDVPLCFMHARELTRSRGKAVEQWRQWALHGLRLGVYEGPGEELGEAFGVPLERGEREEREREGDGGNDR